jgi:subtilisin-like proprotein convertase family protein
VTWNVANTNAAPVNCGFVNILFSADLGLNFTTALALFTPNDGTENIVVPSLQTSVGRVMVECSDNIFLDINNVNITVLEDPNPDFSINLEPDTLAVCAPANAVVDVDVVSLGGFTGPVALSASGAPAGTTTQFSISPINAGGTSQLTIGNTGAASGGTANVTVQGSGSTGTRSDVLALSITPGLPAAPVPVAPADGATFVPQSPTLTWDPVADTDQYLVEIATDSGFGTIVYSQSEASTSHTVGATLDYETEYFWRVSAQNFCGGVASVTRSFTVVAAPIEQCAFPFASIPDNGAALESTLTLGAGGTVFDIDVLVDAAHPNSGDLVFSLRHETTGTTVVLLDQPGAPQFPGGCTTADVSSTFDDEAGSDAEDQCNVTAPGIGPLSRPLGMLSDFDGEALAGDWTLIASDANAGVAGDLLLWCVEVTAGAAAVDSDGDGVADDVDNCTQVANPDQRDTNGDGYGNLCDADLNGDLITNAGDLGILRTVFFTANPDADFDGNGVVNAADLGILRTLFFAPPGPSGLAP